MERIIFDPKNILTVDIGKVKPNAWNPKNEGTEEYTKIVKSIKTKGLRSPIIVRRVGEDYEVIDGCQRLAACRELGYAEVLVYNCGEVSDKEARELTEWFQLQVPFDAIKEAELLDFMFKNFNPDELEIPYTFDEAREKIALLSMNWDDYTSHDVEFGNDNPNLVFSCSVDDETFVKMKELIKGSTQGGKKVAGKSITRLKLSAEVYAKFGEVLAAQREKDLSDDDIVKNFCEKVCL